MLLQCGTDCCRATPIATQCGCVSFLACCAHDCVPLQSLSRPVLMGVMDVPSGPIFSVQLLCMAGSDTRGRVKGRLISVAAAWSVPF